MSHLFGISIAIESRLLESDRDPYSGGTGCSIERAVRPSSACMQSR